ncbi:disease resistance protein RRS1B-like [Mercurialis annua]|uniref:disease resistance protein RRS1B-like n=1 Tax=Mercurialis annua TaxID=3986 RepID=UPI0024AFE760|nr:disease resistance protein RRS1B-like [Mercurialis annua]
MSKIDELDKNPNVFKTLNYFNFTMGCLPDELPYLHCNVYPLETFPANFAPVELVELHLPYTMETLEIRVSQQEGEVDVTKGTPNLIEVELDDVDKGVSHLTHREIDVIEETSTEENIEILQDIKFQSGQSSVGGENIVTEAV